MIAAEAELLAEDVAPSPRRRTPVGRAGREETRWRRALVHRRRRCGRARGRRRRVGGTARTSPSAEPAVARAGAERAGDRRAPAVRHRDDGRALSEAGLPSGGPLGVRAASNAAPGDDRLSARVESLRAELTAPAKAAGPAVRDFFARIAARRAGRTRRRRRRRRPRTTSGRPMRMRHRAVRSAAAGHGAAPQRPDVEPLPTPRRLRPRAPHCGAPWRIHRRAVRSPTHRQLRGFGGVGARAGVRLGDRVRTPLAGNPTRPASGELTAGQRVSRGLARRLARRRASRSTSSSRRTSRATATSGRWAPLAGDPGRRASRPSGARTTSSSSTPGCRG